jgi:hypothetical protein
MLSCVHIRSEPSLNMLQLFGPANEMPQLAADIKGYLRSERLWDLEAIPLQQHALDRLRREKQLLADIKRTCGLKTIQMDWARALKVSGSHDAINAARQAVLNLAVDTGRAARVENEQECSTCW